MEPKPALSEALAGGLALNAPRARRLDRLTKVGPTVPKRGSLEQLVSQRLLS